jgi:hypothetical protein
MVISFHHAPGADTLRRILLKTCYAGLQGVRDLGQPIAGYWVRKPAAAVPGQSGSACRLCDYARGARPVILGLGTAERAFRRLNGHNRLMSTELR